MRLRLAKPSSARAKTGVSALLVSIGALALMLLTVPGADGAFLAKVTNDNDTVGVRVGCTAYAQDTTIGPASFAYPLGETSIATTGSTRTTADDVTANNNDGSYSIGGVTGGVSNTGACVRDKTTAATFGALATANGSAATSAAFGPTAAVNNPSVFTEEIWFKSANLYLTGGKLIGFGDSEYGESGSYDRHIYMSPTGTIVFGVYPPPANVIKTVISPKSYNDGNWHFAVATLSAAGMVLYVDGVQVGSDPTTTAAQNYSGWWHIGYDNMANWGTTAPLTYHFNGQLAWASVYYKALTAAQIQSQYVAGSTP